MELEAFACEIMDCLRGDLPQYQIDMTKVLKNNDTELVGLIFKQDEESLAPTIYLNGLYEGYENQTISMDMIVKLLLNQLEEAQKNCLNMENLAKNMDYDHCKHSIVYRLVSKTRNSKLLDGIPHINMLDLAIVFYVVKEIDDTGVKSIKITNELMKSWGVQVGELMKCATRNTPQIFPVVQRDIIDVLQPLFKEKSFECLTNEEKIDMIVITNQVGLNGASAILYKGVLSQLAEEYDSDLWILPSSIHEVIIVPKSIEGMESYSEMVRDINEKYVDEEEILSDRVYLYLKDEKIIT